MNRGMLYILLVLGMLINFFMMVCLVGTFGIGVYFSMFAYLIFIGILILSMSLGDEISKENKSIIEDELEFLNRQIMSLKLEIECAKIYIAEHKEHTRAEQSLHVYAMWLLQLNKRKEQILKVR